MMRLRFKYKEEIIFSFASADDFQEQLDAALETLPEDHEQGYNNIIKFGTFSAAHDDVQSRFVLENFTIEDVRDVDTLCDLLDTLEQGYNDTWIKLNIWVDNCGPTDSIYAFDEDDVYHHAGMSDDELARHFWENDMVPDLPSSVDEVFIDWDRVATYVTEGLSYISLDNEIIYYESW